MTNQLQEGALSGAVAPIVEGKADLLAPWFALYLEVQGGPEKSHTRRAKVGDLKSFFRFLAHQFHELAEDITDEALAAVPVKVDYWTKSYTEAFLNFLLKEKRHAASTVCRRFATLQHAAGWISQHRDFIVGNPCDGVTKPVQPRREWRGVGAKARNRLKHAAEILPAVKRRKDQSPVRDQAIFALANRCALRAQEICDLNAEQVQGKTLAEVIGKGRSVDNVKLPKEARDALGGYLKERGKQDGPLFLSRYEKRLTPQSVNKVLKRIAALANAQSPDAEPVHVTVHNLRHTCIKAVVDHPAHDARHGARVGRHKSLSHAQVYMELTGDEVLEAMENSG